MDVHENEATTNTISKSTPSMSTPYIYAIISISRFQLLLTWQAKMKHQVRSNDLYDFLLFDDRIWYSYQKMGLFTTKEPNRE